MGRGYRGKAMVISIDKATAVKMYDKVQKHWKRYREKLETALQNTPEDGERETLRAQIQYMEENGYGGGGLSVTERNRRSEREGGGHSSAP